MSKIKLGRIDGETVSNLGIITGGTAVNSIPEEVIIKGEARSHNTQKLENYIANMKKIFETEIRKAARKIDGKLFKPKLDFKVTLNYPKLYVPKDHPIIKLIEKSTKLAGLKLKVVSMTAGTEANIFFGRGRKVITTGFGAMGEHTKKEYLNLKDFFLSAEVLLNTISHFAKCLSKNTRVI